MGSTSGNLSDDDLSSKNNRGGLAELDMARCPRRLGVPGAAGARERADNARPSLTLLKPLAFMFIGYDVKMILFC